MRPILDLKPWLLMVSFWVSLMMVHAHAVDWVTTDGKTYQDVSVVKVEPDAVTILHKYGGALVPLDKLPPDLQKKFHYDPVKAKIAADARAKEEAANALALKAEKAKADAMKKQKVINDANEQEKAQTTLQQQ